MRICALLLSIGLAGIAPAPAADIAMVEQIVAKVNADIITRTDLNRARRELEANLKQRGATPQQIADAVKQGEKDILRDRIDNLLLIQRGKDLNLTVDSEVTKYLGDLQRDNKIADPEKFQAWVREATGMTFEDFKQEVRNGILTQRVIGQEVYSKVSIPKADIEAYYEKNKAQFLRKERVFLREILIATQGKDAAGMAAAEKKAKDIVVRARKGEKFADLVRDNSDAVTAKQGGALEPFEKADLNAELVAMIWDKPKGTITEATKVPAGWLILRVDEHQKEGQAELADVENEIRERLGATVMQPKVRGYLTELRANSFVEIREGFTDTGAAPGKDTRWTDPALLKPDTISREEVMQARTKRLLFMIPVPGTQVNDTRKSSSK
jgi:peptidyl-prolyl cis-trans isomerase SurA